MVENACSNPMNYKTMNYKKLDFDYIIEIQNRFV